MPLPRYRRRRCHAARCRHPTATLPTSRAATTFTAHDFVPHPYKLAKHTMCELNIIFWYSEPLQFCLVATILESMLSVMA